MENLWHGVQMVLNPEVLLSIVIASSAGLLVGAIPGLTAVMGTALLVPIVIYLEPISAIAAVASLSAAAIFAGDIPGALLRIPGTPASAAYVDEAYKITQRGSPEIALGASLGASVCGGIIGTVMLAFFAPLLARLTAQFSSPEYFWLILLGLTCAVVISREAPLKGFVALLMGLLLSTIGIDPVHGAPRFTFGSVNLLGGISFIPVMIGLFAVSEVFKRVYLPGSQQSPPCDKMGHVFRAMINLIFKNKKQILRGSVLGTLIGAIPGAGADIAAWVSYTVSRKFSRTPEKFGRGHVEGIVESGASNNGALSGAWIPTLVFGIPGDSITAIILGVLLLKGVEPGPAIFVKQPEMVYAIFLSFLIANCLMFPLGGMLIRLSRHLLKVPPTVLPGLVLAACIVGSYALNNSLFDVLVMLLAGVIGCVMVSGGIPVAPVILGMVLGSGLEFNFAISMMKSDTGLLIFFSRPIAAILAIAVLAIWGTSFYATWKRGRARVRVTATSDH